MSQGKKCNLDKDYLSEEYVNKKRSMAFISRQLGVSLATVHNYLKRYGIARRTPGESLMNDLANQTIGDWRVTSEKQWTAGKHLRWKCQCALCNQFHWVLARSLYSGTSTKCNPCRRRLWRGGYAELTGTHWKQILESARTRNLPVEITAQEAWELFQSQGGRCALSGLPIKFGYKSESTASLDRIDNSKGYIPGNLQWLHKDINKMKWAFSQDYFVGLCQSIASFQAGRSE